MPPRKKQTDKGLRIVKAALHVFSQKGYHNTKISDIVQEAGVAQGTFYLYFPSKRDLLLSLVNEFGRNVSDMVTSHVQRMIDVGSGPGAVEKVVESNLQLLTEFFTYFQEHKEVHRTVMLFASSADNEIMTKVNESRDILVTFSKKNIDILINRGIYRPMDSTLAANATASMVEGLASRYLLSEEETMEPALLAKLTVEQILFGFIKR